MYKYKVPKIYNKIDWLEENKKVSKKVLKQKLKIYC